MLTSFSITVYKCCPEIISINLIEFKLLCTLKRCPGTSVNVKIFPPRGFFGEPPCGHMRKVIPRFCPHFHHAGPRRTDAVRLALLFPAAPHLSVHRPSSSQIPLEYGSPH